MPARIGRRNDRLQARLGQQARVFPVLSEKKRIIRRAQAGRGQSLSAVGAGRSEDGGAEGVGSVHGGLAVDDIPASIGGSNCVSIGESANLPPVGPVYTVE